MSDLSKTVFGTPRQHVVTYSKWCAITNRITERINSTEFAIQMRQVYAGKDETLGKAFDEKVQRFKTFLSETSLAIPDEKAFAGYAFRNLVLNGPFMPRPSFKELSGFAEYAAFESIPQSLYSDLYELEVDEILLENWTTVSAAVNAKILPSVKAVDRALLEYEIPLAGSPKIEKLPIEGLQKVTRGCAAVCFGAFAETVVQSVVTHNFGVLMFIPVGLTGAVLFVAITPLLPHLETYLSRLYKKALSPPKTS